MPTARTIEHIKQEFHEYTSDDYIVDAVEKRMVVTEALKKVRKIGEHMARIARDQGDRDAVGPCFFCIVI